MLLITSLTVLGAYTAYAVIECILAGRNEKDNDAPNPPMRVKWTGAAADFPIVRRAKQH